MPGAGLAEQAGARHRPFRAGDVDIIARIVGAKLNDPSPAIRHREPHRSGRQHRRPGGEIDARRYTVLMTPPRSP